MNSIIFKCLLVASLGANIFLVNTTVRREFGIPAGLSNDAPKGKRSASTDRDRLVHSTNSSVSPAKVLRAELRDPAMILERLTALGLPPYPVSQGVHRALSEKHQIEALQVARKRMIPGAAGNLEAAEKRLASERARIVLPETATAEERFEREKTSKQLHYGDLPDEKIEFVKETHARMRRAPDAELKAALETKLTPAEVEDRMKFHSQMARSIQGHIQYSEIDLPTYEKLFSAIGTLPPEGSFNRNEIEHLRTYQAILGDEAFLKTLPTFSGPFRTADAAYREAGASPAVRADNAILTEELMARLQAETSAAARRELAASGRQALLERGGLNTPEHIALFDQSNLGTTLQRYMR